jgi:hypothetical protein
MCFAHCGEPNEWLTRREIFTVSRNRTWHYNNTAAGEMHALDQWAAGALRQADLTVKIFLPLPVLGVPGWWAQNEALCFYDDQLVFRPAPNA